MTRPLFFDARLIAELAVVMRPRRVLTSAFAVVTLLLVLAPANQIRAEEILKYRPIGNNKTMFALAQRYVPEAEYKLYEAHYAEIFKGKSKAQILKECIEYITTDLNRDGHPEVFLIIALPGWCGSGGSMMFVLQRRNGVWREVYSGGNSYYSITLLDEWDGPYRRVEYNSDLFGTRDILRWDGDHAWGEERDKDGNTVEQYLRHPRPQPTSPE